jgi:hypothetical protein
MVLQWGTIKSLSLLVLHHDHFRNLFIFLLYIQLKCISFTHLYQIVSRELQRLNHRVNESIFRLMRRDRVLLFLFWSYFRCLNCMLEYMSFSLRLRILDMTNRTVDIGLLGSYRDRVSNVCRSVIIGVYNSGHTEFIIAKFYKIQ